MSRLGKGLVVAVLPIAIGMSACAAFSQAEDITVDAGNTETDEGQSAGTDNADGLPSINGRPVFVFDPPPEGYWPALFDGSGDDPNFIPTFAIYGQADGDDPFANGDLVVFTAGPGISEEDIADGNDPLDVNGTSVWLDVDDSLESATWFNMDGTITGLLSTSLSASALLDVAADLLAVGEVDPARFELLADDVSGLSLVGGAVSVRYFATNGQEPEVLLRLAAVDNQSDVAGDDLLAAWFAGGQHPDGPGGALRDMVVDVLDHDGMLVTATSRPDGSVRLVFEQNRQLVSLTVQYLNGDDVAEIWPTLLHLIDTVRPATQAELDGLRAERDAIPTPPVPPSASTYSTDTTDLTGGGDG